MATREKTEKKSKKATNKTPASSKTSKMRKPARQILAVLTKIKGSASRSTIAAIAEKTEKLANHRIADEAGNYSHLVQAGFIVERIIQTDLRKERTYTITPAGREALKVANIAATTK